MSHSELDHIFTTHRPLVDLIEDFEFLDDWEDRYTYLIDLGKGLAGLPDTFKVEAHRVRGPLGEAALQASLFWHRDQHSR